MILVRGVHALAEESFVPARRRISAAEMGRFANRIPGPICEKSPVNFALL